MPTKNTYTQEEQVFRYLNNQMTEQERNAFEREMQKDPFLAEAVEGVSRFPVSEMAADIQALKKKLITERRDNKRFWWYAAASVLVIVVSTIWLFDLEKKTNQVVTQNEEKEVVASKPEKEVPAQPELSPEEDTETEVGTVNDELVLEMVDREAEDADDSSVSNLYLKAPELKNLSGVTHQPRYKNVLDPRLKTVQVKEMTNPPVAQSESIFMVVDMPDTVVKSTLPAMGEKEQAQVLSFMSEDSDMTMDEVVVVGYGTTKKQSVTGAVSAIIQDREAMPALGWEKYQAYLDDACLHPTIGSPAKKVVVKLSFVVNPGGDLEQFKILRSTNDKYNQEAIRIVETGLSWLPEVKDGISQPSTVKLRLIFPAGLDQ